MRKGRPPEPSPSDGELRLRAEDAEDLAVISACLQDALVSVRDLAYDQGARNFMLVANRFRWEGGAAGEGANTPFERTLCGVIFDEIDGVAYRGFHRSEEDRILALLSIRSIPGRSIPGHSIPGHSIPGHPIPASQIGATGGVIDLEFAAGATIRLTVAAISCRARDFGEPWPTVWQPGHQLDEPE
jgi:hypothetical protein